MIFDDIKIYLPKYLTPELQKKLFRDLNQFPENIDNRLYSSECIEQDIIYQGDGIKDLLVVDMSRKEFKNKDSMIFSNTCDIDIRNTRFFSANIIYSPIVKLEDYINKVLNRTSKTEDEKKSHINSIKKQEISQMFYLPEGKIDYEGLVFFDTINSCQNKLLNRDNLNTKRIFSLSQYGHYLFLFKLSIHFCRISEKVERTY